MNKSKTHNGFWEDHPDAWETVLRLFNDGRSMGYIAKYLMRKYGHKITRSGISGKIWRMRRKESRRDQKASPTVALVLRPAADDQKPLHSRK